jgi:hypothetical protein
MVKTIVAAAVAFAVAVFTLDRAPGLPPYVEPLLLLVLGAAFLIAGRFAPNQRTRQATREARA